MKRQIVSLLLVLLFATIGFTQPPDPDDRGRHIPKTLVSENSASLLLKDNGFQGMSKEEAKCPEDSGVSGVDVGGQELGSHEPANMPAYVKKYHEGLEKKESHIELWNTVIKGVTAHVKYCYYPDPENDYIVIYLAGEPKE